MGIDVLGVGCCHREWSACVSPSCSWHGMVAWLLILARVKTQYSAKMSSHLDYRFDRNSFVVDQKMLPEGLGTDAQSIQT